MVKTSNQNWTGNICRTAQGHTKGHLDYIIDTYNFTNGSALNLITIHIVAAREDIGAR